MVYYFGTINTNKKTHLIFLCQRDQVLHRALSLIRKRRFEKTGEKKKTNRKTHHTHTNRVFAKTGKCETTLSKVWF